jgi:hypothetical protein
MGFNIGTIAVRGKAIEDIHVALRLRPTEGREPDPESPVAAAMLPSGWYLLYLNDRIYPTSDELHDLSLNGELIFLDICETVMVSCATCWRNGKEIWSIGHDSQRGLDDLEICGDVPECFERISQRLQTLQKEKGDADYVFDIPVDVTCELTGFRYDGNPNGYPVDEFVVLERIQQPRKWWQFWR